MQVQAGAAAAVTIGTAYAFRPLIARLKDARPLSFSGNSMQARKFDSVDNAARGDAIAQANPTRAGKPDNRQGPVAAASLLRTSPARTSP